MLYTNEMLIDKRVLIMDIDFENTNTCSSNTLLIITVVRGKHFLLLCVDKILLK